MVEESWLHVRKIFDDALGHKPEERPRFVRKACGGDKSLFHEVESLLSSLDGAESFMETPAVAMVADVIDAETKKLETGKRFGHYEILRQIGTGGMGDVYLAKDTTLDRNVAVKILNEKFSKDESNLKRFFAEAKAASALNHPNILIIHEVVVTEDAHYIVSEFIEGKTLREVRREKPLNLPEILDISNQIASALCAAHEARLVHRDIKPENIMIRPDGYVKILDFGLAKLVEYKNKSILGLEDSTIGQNHTAQGLILGTVNYMSPEQAKGETVDERTDIFSFGALIYEMVAGKAPFVGDSTAETFANLLNAELLPLSQITSDVPFELERIVAKMLCKAKDLRYQTMTDVHSDLKNLKQRHSSEQELIQTDSPLGQTTQVFNAVTGDGNLLTGEVRSSFSRQFKRHRVAAGFALGAALVTLLGTVAFWKINTQNSNQEPSDLLASLRIKPLIIWDSEAGEGDTAPKFSPNGTMIAYSATTHGQQNIWTKQIPDGKANKITDGRWDYSNPIWSPDGQRIAVVSNRENHLSIWSMPFSGGELTLIKTMDSKVVSLLHWSKNGTTIFYRVRFNLFALDIASKTVNQLTNFDEENQAQFFNISPNEDRIAYSSGPNERLQIYVMPINGGDPVQVTTNEEGKNEYPFWLPDGNRILFSSTRSGIFQTFVAYLNEDKTAQINLGITDTLIADVSPDGSRILLKQSREESDLWQVKIASKKESQITFDSGLELWSDAAPDNKSIVFQTTTTSKHVIESSILVRSIDETQPINIANGGFSPTFSPDGRKIAFLRDADNLINLWITGRNGEGELQLTTSGIWFAGFSIMPYNRVQVKDYSWSPNGSSLIYSAKNAGLWNIWQVFADGENASRQITDNTDVNVNFSCPLFASDGKRIAYLSTAESSSAGSPTTLNISRLNGEVPEVVFSSEKEFELIGWENKGTELLIAMPEESSAVQPIKVELITVSTGNNQTEIASIDEAYFYNIQMAPDGKEVAFVTREDGKDNIHVISIASGENLKITTNVDPNLYVSNIAWSPDGESVYFSKQKKVGTISMIENFK
jgi:serine/threonine protein kinase